MVEVTQADRDAARLFVLAIFDVDNDADATAARAIEAFARHREAALATANAEVAEIERLRAELDARDGQIAAWLRGQADKIDREVGVGWKCGGACLHRDLADVISEGAYREMGDE